MSRVRVEPTTMSSIADSGTCTPRPKANAATRAIDMMSDAELLAMVLGNRASPARLDEGVAGLARASIGDLAEQPGIGPARATRLVASVELGRRAVIAALARTHTAHARQGRDRRVGETQAGGARP